MYFVTICSFRRRSIFGQIRGNEAILSRIGEIIRTCWIEVPQHFPSVKIETYCSDAESLAWDIDHRFKLAR
jgi:putative transposase